MCIRDRLYPPKGDSEAVVDDPNDSRCRLEGNMSGNEPDKSRKEYDISVIIRCESHQFRSPEEYSMGVLRHDPQAINHLRGVRERGWQGIGRPRQAPWSCREKTWLQGFLPRQSAVSYTHLDVYKRQEVETIIVSTSSLR